MAQNDLAGPTNQLINQGRSWLTELRKDGTRREEENNIKQSNPPNQRNQKLLKYYLDILTGVKETNASLPNEDPSVKRRLLNMAIKYGPNKAKGVNVTTSEPNKVFTTLNDVDGSRNTDWKKGRSGSLGSFTSDNTSMQDISDDSSDEKGGGKHKKTRKGRINRNKKTRRSR